MYWTRRFRAGQLGRTSERGVSIICSSFKGIFGFTCTVMNVYATADISTRAILRRFVQFSNGETNNKDQHTHGNGKLPARFGVRGVSEY